ncbi:MAG: TasA family protein [Candidatus Borkfalkiaceae bacterium]|nr:TasA family protein [Christensenellaceae bacterium]
MKKKNVIFSAVLTIALCLSLLAGATFAYFSTDSKVNIAITSGKVDVVATADNLKLYSLETINPTTFEGTEVNRTENGTFVNGGTATMNGGNLTLDGITAGDKVTFDITVKNNSTINVKYRVLVSCDSDDGLFNELNIKFGDYSSKVITIWEDLAPGSEDKTMACSVELPAKSTAQGKTCNITFAVEAVQSSVAVKNDKHYPADAASLKTALTYGGDVYVEKDFTVDETKTSAGDRAEIKQPTTIELDATITVPGSLENSNNWAALYIGAETTINATTGGINCLDKTDTSALYMGGTYAAHIAATGKTVTVNGGNYYAGGTVFNVQSGTLVVNGGFFKVYPDIGTKDYRYVLNCVDANYKNGTANIIVKGGTFVNFDPSNNLAEGANTNFVADGYSVVSETKANGEVWYTVVKGEGVVASTQEEMNDGIQNSTEKEVTVIVPANANVTLDNGLVNEGAKSRNLTFVGDGSQTMDVAKNAPAAEGANHLNYQRGSSITFENMTIENGTGTYDGIVCDELVYKNCVIKGVTTLYGKATFIDCTFENTMANQYSIWTWGGTDVKFENCTFNTNGKAILVFGEEKTTNVTVENCIFNDRTNGAAGKAAIEIGEANYGKHNNFTVVINNVKVASGFADGKNTGSKVWANKNNMSSTYLSVTIDGVKAL